MLALFVFASILTVGSLGSSFAESTVDVDEQRTIVLIGTGVDPDNDDLTYLWEQTGGESVDLSAYDVAEPTFLSPLVDNGETKTLSFTLTVSDPFGGSSQESINIVVHPINHDPIAKAGKDKLIFPSVNAVTVFATGYDIDGDILSFSWKQLAGQPVDIANLNAKHLTVERYQLDFNDMTPLTFEVTVDDGFGGTDSDTVDIFLAEFSANNPSIAVDAGPIQIVNEGSDVTLHGSGWEINNSPISFSWIQHLGPKVSLSSTVIPTPDFTAPYIDGEEAVVLSFVLTGYVPGSGFAQDTAIVKVLPVNNPPIADAGPDQSVRESSQVKLIGTVSDPDGDRVNHAWNQIAGPAVQYNTFLTELTFTAPPLASDETANLEFELMARDSFGLTSYDAVSVLVSATNSPPTAHAGPDQIVVENTNVRLVGTGFDVDNDPLTYSWKQINGKAMDVNVSDNALTFTAPNTVNNRPSSMLFEFKVSDSFGGSDTDVVKVTIVPANGKPSANAGDDLDVDENTVVILSCVGQDPDGDILTYSWSQISGPSIVIDNPNNTMITFTAPSVVDTTLIQFKCTVSDGEFSASDTVGVTVYNTLTLDIVADAGDDRIVNENRNLSLDGSGSFDPENQPLQYSWVQLSGESVSLDDSSSITPSFRTPSVINGQIKILEFELTVFDSNGRSDMDTVVITVDPVNAPPEVEVTAKQLS